MHPEVIETLKHWDTDIFLYLNGIHSTFWDFVMYWTSEKMIWIPAYILFVYLLIKYYKKKAWIIIPMVLIMVLVSDQLSVLIKNLTLRPRPCHEPELQFLIHLVKNKCGGEYGFVSSHAVNHFALATFLSLLFQKKIVFIISALILWATLISYSRIYLGVHYPGDVICGGIIGAFLGFTFGKLTFYLITKYGNKFEIHKN